MTVTLLEPPPAPTLEPVTRTYAVETIRDAQGIRAERAILHVVDHRKAEKPTLSDAELVLTAEPRLERYLAAQIGNVLADPATADAAFEPDSAVGRSCRTLLAQPQTFVAESQRIAQALWEATGTDQRIAAGSLLVCRFRAENHTAPLAALLKIDPTEVLLQTVSRQDGRVVVGLRVAEDALPTARERLQKAALVAPAEYARLGDLLLLDKLTEKPAADFFAGSRFLAVRPLPSPRELTETFFRTYLENVDQLGLTPPQEDYLERKVVDVLQDDSVDVTAWTGKLNKLPARARETLRQELSGALGTGQIAIDPGFAATKLVKTRRLRGDCGILIEFDRVAEKRVYVEGETYEEDGDRITPVTLRVPNLERIQ